MDKLPEYMRTATQKDAALLEFELVSPHGEEGESRDSMIFNSITFTVTKRKICVDVYVRK